MKRWNLKIELMSYFCTTDGENAPGLIHDKTALDHGIPYIPAKRIKGCLLEAAKEMADNDEIEQEMLPRIFGSPGQEQSEGIRLGDGYLCRIPGYLLKQETDVEISREEYLAFQKIMEKNSEFSADWLEEIFTRRQTRTALEESQIAEKHSLRTIQVVPAGMVFNCPIEGELEEKEKDILCWCAKGMRYMGLGISRGMGEVHCVLEEIKETKTCEQSCEPTEQFPLEAEVSLSYEIELQMPVVLAADAESGSDYIPASTIAGALAGMYIQRHSLGKDAHTDAGFRRIFLRDGVQFGHAFFKKENLEYYPCPRVIALVKEHPEQWFYIMDDVSAEVRRKKISGQIAFSNREENTIAIASPRKEIHFHHARPENRGIAHPLNDRVKNSEENMGQFFQYTALSKGQTFSGTWIGKWADLQDLIECLKEHQYTLMLGRSRTAEYGRASVHIGDLTVLEHKNKTARGKQWLLWLVSPLVYRKQDGMYATGFEQLLKELEEKLECNITSSKEMCDYTVLGGFNSKWRLPAKTYPALAPGSALCIETDQDITAEEIEQQRWGMLTGKGCGQVKVERMERWRKLEQVKEDSLKKCRGGLVETDPKAEQKQNGEKSVLLDVCLEYKEKRCQEEEDRGAALQELEERDKGNDFLPASSAISVLEHLARTLDAKQKSQIDKILDKEADKIQNEEKKNMIQKFLNPCNGKSNAFITCYLDAAKWRARNRETGLNQEERVNE